MKRSLIHALAVLLIGASVAIFAAACGEDPTPTPTSPPPAAPTPTPPPAAAPTPTPPPAAAPTPTPTTDPLDAIIEAARAEGEVEVWINWSEETVNALQDKWQEDFGWPIKITSVPKSASAATAEVIAATEAGQEVGDLGQPSTGLLLQLVEAEAVESRDWVGLYGGRFPGVEEASNVYFDELAGYGLHFWDVLYEFTYNTNLLSEAEAPKTWEELTDPKWKGNIAIDARGYPFNFMLHSPDWDEASIMELVQALAENEPVLPARSRGDEVIAGEVAIQIGGCNRDDIAKGAPIECIYPDYTMFNPLIATPFKNAKHPNLGPLFAAWLVTDGFPTYASIEFNGRLSNPDSTEAQELTRQSADRDITIVEQSDFGVVARDENLRRSIGEFWTQTGGGG